MREETKEIIKYSIFMLIFVIISMSFMTKTSFIIKGDYNSVFGDEECKYKSPSNSTNDIEYLKYKNGEKYCCAEIVSGFYKYERDEGTLTRFILGKYSSGEIRNEQCNKLK